MWGRAHFFPVANKNHSQSEKNSIGQRIASGMWMAEISFSFPLIVFQNRESSGSLHCSVYSYRH